MSIAACKHLLQLDRVTLKVSISAFHCGCIAVFFAVRWALSIKTPAQVQIIACNYRMHAGSSRCIAGFCCVVHFSTSCDERAEKLAKCLSLSKLHDGFAGCRHFHLRTCVWSHLAVSCYTGSPSALDLFRSNRVLLRGHLHWSEPSSATLPQAPRRIFAETPLSVQMVSMTSICSCQSCCCTAVAS